MRHRTAAAGVCVIVALAILVFVPMPFFHRATICIDVPSPGNHVAACNYGLYYSVTAQSCLGYGAVLGLGEYQIVQLKCTLTYGSLGIAKVLWILNF